MRVVHQKANDARSGAAGRHLLEQGAEDVDLVNLDTNVEEDYYLPAVIREAKEQLLVLQLTDFATLQKVAVASGAGDQVVVPKTK